MMLQGNESLLTHHLGEVLKRRTPDLMNASAHFAVLVPLVEQNGTLHLLYETRSAKLRHQPHEICFPGGRMEQGESPSDTALRETQEELGIQKSDITLLGALDFIAHRANFILHPILGVVAASALESLALNPDEVESTLLIPLSHLLETPPLEYQYDLTPHVSDDFPYEIVGIPRNYNWQSGGENVPVYPLEHGSIWGMTGRITHHLCNLIHEHGLEELHHG